MPAPEVTREPAAVNAPNDDKRAVAGRKFSPHVVLIARVQELRCNLRMSDGGARALTALLWGCGKRGRGQGCAPHEAMTCLRQGGLATAMGIDPGSVPGRSNVGSVKRAIAELRDMAIVRWRRVHMAERAPDFQGSGDVFTGRAALSGCCVYYVDVGACWTALGRPDLATGNPGANATSHEIRSDLTMRSGTVLSNPQNPQKTSGTQVAPVVNCELNLTTTTDHSQWNTARPPPVPVVVVVGTELAESDFAAAYAYWLERIGAGYGCPPHVGLAVREALRGAMGRGGLTLAMVRDVIDGATQRELGGASYDWIHEPGRSRLFGPGLFWNEQRERVSGCVMPILRTVAANRARLERLAAGRGARARASAAAAVADAAERPMTMAQTARYLALMGEGLAHTDAMRRALEDTESVRFSAGSRR